MKSFTARLLGAAALVVCATAASAQTELTVYTAIEAEDLKRYAEEFNKAHPDIKVNFVRDSTGVVTAKLLAEKDNPQADVVWGLAATSLLITLDMATGAHLQESSMIGHSPLTAARFYGLGNMAFAVFASASLMVAGAFVTWSPRRREGLLVAACVLAVTLWVVAHPSLGADVGGALTLVPVYGVVFAVLAGMRFSLRNVALLVLAGAATFALLAGAMALTGTETHLTSFLSDGDGAWDTIRRKLETNWRVLRITTWAWMVPIVVAFLVAAMFPRGRSRIRMGGTPLRATFLGIIAVGVVGAALNDSGVVITAMALIYVGTFLVLILERRPFADPELIEPFAATAAPTPSEVPG